MSGIRNYFHGEEGMVVVRKWAVNDDNLAFVIQLGGNPHRERAQDYASDIGIDPTIQVGDEVVYVRLSSYTGLWVKANCMFSSAVDLSLARRTIVTELARRYLELQGTSRLLATLWAWLIGIETGIEVTVDWTDIQPIEQRDKPSTRPSVFLSHEARSSPLAQRLYEGLKREARVPAWLARAEPGAPPDRQGEELETWLRQAVRASQAFVLLLTTDALESDWVRNELKWAAEKARENPETRLILMNLEAAIPPAEINPADWVVIDCKGLNLGEIMEELYAAIFQRPTRREWLEEQTRRGWSEPNAPSVREQGYAHLVTDGGSAESLKWHFDSPEPRWTLRYKTRKGDVKKVSGQGEWQAVDPDIVPGNRIAMFPIWPGQVWMRSEDPDLSGWDTIEKYHQRIHGGSPRENCSLCHRSANASDDPPSATWHQRFYRWITVACALLFIGVSEAALLPLLSGEGPADLSIDVRQTLSIIFQVLLGSTIFIYGASELIGFAHPALYWVEWSKSPFRYCAKALALVLWNSMLSPLINLFAILVISILIIGIPIKILHGLVQFNETLMFLIGLTTIYVLSVIFGLIWLGELAMRGPQDIFVPGFKWIPIPYSGFVASLCELITQLGRALSSRSSPSNRYRLFHN